MKKPFIKMHGLGNDFAIFDGRSHRLDFSPEKIHLLSDRRKGIGFDQMVIVDPPKTAGTNAFLRIYNANGGEVEACGNATRCITSLLLQETGKTRVILETQAATLEGWMNGDKVIVNMGIPSLEWQEIPLSHKENTLSLDLSVQGLKNPVAVNMGNPHAVFFVDKVSSVALETVGPEVERHPLFPEGVNVEVAEVLSASKIRMRVWERGVGITQACGTGACAVAVAGVRRGLTNRAVTVVLDGGDLQIEWRESDGHVLMTGGIAEAYRGEVDF